YPCRYQKSKITIIDEFLNTAKDQAEKKNWLRRADQILDYLDELGDRCAKELDDIEKAPEKRIDYTEADLNKMVIRDGEILAPVLGGDENVLKPVFLTGIMGWFHDDHYKIIRNYGYNCSAFEWEMVNTDNEGSTVYFTNKCKALSDTNMAFQVLFSPHYISGEQYNQYPSLDPLGFRRGQFISPYNVSSPDLKTLIAHHVQNIVPILKDFPNLIGYDLENELYSFPYPDFEYSKWTEDNISYDNPWEAQIEYNQHNMYELVTWFRDEIEKIDNSKVIFTKCCPGLEIPGYEREKISDILSAHSFWSYSEPYPTDDFAANFFLEGMELDTYNSFDKNKIITEGELHLNIVKPQGDFISEKFTNWSMWNMYVRGKDASHIWGWGIDVEDYSNMFHIQPWAVYGAAKANMDVNRVSEYVAPFAKAPRDYALFYGGSGIEELYKAATFSDANFDFITDMTVKKGLDKYKFVIILDDATPAKETLNALKKAGTPVVTLSSDADMKTLWKQIASSFAKFKVAPLVSPKKFGLDCRSYKKDGKTVFYLSNYSKEKIKVNLPKKSADLLTGKEYLTITLEPLDFYLMIN
ncbi:MAG: hypothetical protein KBT47_03935, partial [Armatimonadetes bacterium]|nr:hypothetical protein [Candidatus Hippobium faecium]